MKKWIKWTGIAGLSAVGLTGLGGMWAIHAAKKNLTPEALVARLEKKHNLRASVESTEVSLWSRPARLVVTGLQLSPADGTAGTPLTQRPKSDLGSTYAKVNTITLEVDSLALLKGEVLVTAAELSGGDLKGDLLPDGANSLALLFAKPKKDKPEPKAETEEESGFSLKASMLPISGRVQRIAIQDSRLRLRNRKSKSLIELYPLNATLNDLQIDPANLTAANSVTINLTSHLLIDKAKDDTRYCDLDIACDGKVTPFSATTGKLNPDLGLVTVFKQGSWIQALPALEKLQKNIEKGRQAGLNLRNLAEKSTLQKDAVLPLKLTDSRAALTAPTQFVFNDYTLALADGSFMDAAKEVHEYKATLTASEALSTQSLQGADQFLKGLGGAGESLRKAFIAPLIKDNLITLDFVSSGPTRKPDISSPVIDNWKENASSVLESFLENIQQKATAPTPAPIDPTQPPIESRKAEPSPPPSLSEGEAGTPEVKGKKKKKTKSGEAKPDAKDDPAKALGGALEKLLDKHGDELSGKADKLFQKLQKKAEEKKGPAPERP